MEIPCFVGQEWLIMSTMGGISLLKHVVSLIPFIVVIAANVNQVMIRRLLRLINTIGIKAGS